MSADPSPLAAFRGEITPAHVSLLYQAGLVVVALLMILLPAIYVALIVLTAVGVSWHTTQNITILADLSGIIFRLILYGAPIVAGGTLVVFMVKPFFARRPKPPELPALRAEDEPLLFSFIERICRLVQAPLPRRVEVDCQVNASASFRRGTLSFLGNDLTLTIGLPLVAGLNMREFGGVLAHEFGHFAQGAGMRLTYVIRQINFWFSAVVYERDQWDLRLDHAARNSDWRIALMLHVARGCIWLSRRLLWALMHLGHAVSCFMLRQMEYDADRYASKLAGSDAFAGTTLRIRTLAVASQASFADLRESWKSQRLPDNLPVFITRKAAALPREIQQELQSSLDLSKTGAFDTHPSDADRVRAAQAAAEPGVFHLTEPATKLFRDFAALSRELTRAFYEKDLGIALTDANLVATEESLEESAALQAAQEALRRYLHGVNTVFVPVVLTPSDLQPPPDAQRLRAPWNSARARLEQQAGETVTALKSYAEADARWCDATAALFLQEAYFTIEPGDSGLGLTPTYCAAMLVIDESTKQMASLRPALESFSREARAWLAASLQGLHHAEADAAFPRATTLRREAADLVEVLARLGACSGSLHEIRRRFPAFAALAGNRGNHSQPWRVDEQLGLLAKDFRGHLDQIQGHLRGAPYPFRHACGAIALDAFARFETPSPNEVEAICEDCLAHLERLFPLYDRVLGRLIGIAEIVEAEGAELNPEFEA